MKKVANITAKFPKGIKSTGLDVFSPFMQDVIILEKFVNENIQIFYSDKLTSVIGGLVYGGVESHMDMRLSVVGFFNLNCKLYFRVGNKEIQVFDGDIYEFDASKRHSVLASTTGKSKFCKWNFVSVEV